MRKPKVMYYHDGRHPHIYRYEPPMHKEGYVAMVDELAGTPVEAIAFCLGEGRTMLHDTRAGELMGHNVESWDHLIFRRAAQNAKRLIDDGHDPLRIVCERAQELGMQVYPTLIVQRGGAGNVQMRCCVCLLRRMSKPTSSNSGSTARFCPILCCARSTSFTRWTGRATG